MIQVTESLGLLQGPSSHTPQPHGLYKNGEIRVNGYSPSLGPDVYLEASAMESLWTLC
jgi:hypothetical protein